MTVSTEYHIIYGLLNLLIINNKNIYATNIVKDGFVNR